MISSYKEACNILNIDYNNINLTEEEIKKQYRYNALKYHPDKNNSDNANEEFIKVTEAYEFLMNKKSNVERNKSYIEILSEYLEHCDLFNNQHTSNLINTILKNIILECEEKSLIFLKNINNHNLLTIIKLIKNYKDILTFDDAFIKKIEELYKSKCDNELHVIINPLIDDLLEDNVYKYPFENTYYIIPLWHKELHFNDNGNQTRIHCNPLLPHNVKIDDDNNIFIELRENIKNIFNKEKYYFNLGNKVYHINNNQINFYTYQEIILKKQGISKIDYNNVLNHKNRSDIIIKLYLILD